MEEEENKNKYTDYVHDEQGQKNGINFFNTTNFFSTSNKPIRIVLDGWMDLVLARIERGEK